ncbi:hypothetical protein GA0074696_6008 [Micromonospora purpureochromogenes]|uniref:Uncharacterized protein n=1 Tax=Micromonospora purpureochromogenes TaxID=47872 RepID=A0A1C5AHA1_9ACTN|nr:hypothetical protein [Micromonospora purpureochromogenes]SCF44496.1 hypothetical protein GA0074696_6008 [Micromonospora purpureochromogenes]
MVSSQEPAVPTGRGSEPRWAPVGPIAMALSAVAVSAAGAFLLRRPDDIGRILGPLVYGLGMVGLVGITARAVAARAQHFARFGVPTLWTRPPVRGVEDVNLRRWENTIRGLRAPWPNERDSILTAARARAEGLPAIVLPAILAPLVAVVGVVLVGRVPESPLSIVVLPQFLIGLVTAVVAVRYGVDGWRARTYLTQFSAPAIDSGDAQLAARVDEEGRANSGPEVPTRASHDR